MSKFYSETIPLACVDPDWQALPQTRALRVPEPCDLSSEEIGELVGLAAQAHFNTIVAPAFDDGLTAFPSSTMVKHGLKRRRPARTRDPLAVMSGAVRTNGLSLYAGINPLSVGPRHLLPWRHPAARRSWLMRDAARRPARIHGSPGVFLCPSNPAVRRLAAELASEICERYFLTGLLLDGVVPGTTDGCVPAVACTCGACRNPSDGLDLETGVRSQAPEVELLPEERQAEALAALIDSMRARARIIGSTLKMGLRVPAGARASACWPTWAGEGLADALLLAECAPGDLGPLAEKAGETTYLMAELPDVRTAAEEPWQAAMATAHFSGWIVDYPAGMGEAWFAQWKELLKEDVQPVELNPVVSAVIVLRGALIAGGGDEVQTTVQSAIARLDRDGFISRNEMAALRGGIEKLVQTEAQPGEGESSAGLMRRLAAATRLLRAAESM